MSETRNSAAGDKPGHYNRLFLVPGNQLFPHRFLRYRRNTLFFMAEDYAACTYRRHHKHKLVLILAAMRAYADGLSSVGLDVSYTRLEPEHDPADTTAWLDRVHEAMVAHGIGEITHYEIQDKGLEKRIAGFAARHGYTHNVLPSPMFLCSRDAFDGWLESQNTPRMASFYRWQRQRLDILINENGTPAGNHWSFDSENRKPLPAGFPVPGLPRQPASHNKHMDRVKHLVDHLFPDHAGNTADFVLPTTRKQALLWLKDFLEQRFTCFGDYEDAISSDSDTLFHSLLSPLMNIGLLTPDEVLEQALTYANQQEIQINNIEGFVRQIIGWREFIYGMYRHCGDKMRAGNHWQHERGLTHHWYDGTTGITPLDGVIDKANRIGYAHHIERLMVAGNLMLLAEIHPHEAYNWFMEMFVDAAPWVMTPNVYGMALFADGGIFTTKPYFCGSNYIRKMSNYPTDDWIMPLDGLFWRFVARNREYLAAQPRLGMLTRNLDKMDAQRRKMLEQHAEEFLRDRTLLQPGPDDRRAA